MMHAPSSITRNCTGVASLEFALILPLLLIVLCGSFDIYQLALAYLKTIAAAETTADLVAQQTSVTTSSIDDIVKAAQLVISPLPPASLGIAIASVQFDAKTGQATTAWQESRGATIANPTALATGLGSKGDSVIVVSTNYAFVTPLSIFLPSGFTLSDLAFSRPRLVSAITHN